jgi:peptidylprolyl isomerase
VYAKGPKEMFCGFFGLRKSVFYLTLDVEVESKAKRKDTQMKKIAVGCSFIAFSALLAGCGCGDVSTCKKNNNESQCERKASMERTKLPSGLEFEVIKAGEGATPKQGQMVAVHYTGWLEKDVDTDKSFDSSVKRGQPFIFQVGIGQVIKGWDEGVMLMKVGEKRRLIIPSDLGYGARGAGASIPPHATLVFDVELLAVK